MNYKPQKIENMKDVSKLANALNRANEEAKKHAVAEDGGTCNFDNPMIRLENWKQTEINSASELSGVTIGEKQKSGYFKGYRFVNTAMYGQANRRTIMAEAAKKSLENDGFDVSMYYQMD